MVNRFHLQIYGPIKRSSVMMLALLWALAIRSAEAQPSRSCDLVYKKIPTVWDEGLPLGNGMLGAMIWQKDGKLRFSLDRADLWDLTPIQEFSLDEWNIGWVYQRWLQPREYMMVQQLFDAPYQREAAPTKLLAGCLELPLSSMGKVDSVKLSLNAATCEIYWEKGIRLKSFIHARHTLGYFKITGLSAEILPRLSVPRFQALSPEKSQTVGLQRLNYPLPEIHNNGNSIRIRQKIGNGAFYDILVKWSYENGILTGAWSIVPNYPSDDPAMEDVKEINGRELLAFDEKYEEHLEWWNNFWEQSSINIPDTLLMRQYYRELYKMGCVSRKGAPAASLQAVWTSDNEDLPPWKNDFHNDMNTQMTYWPYYTSNHLEEAAVFTDWLWNTKEEAAKYTAKYFSAPGLNFPGVAALNAYPLGGWVQYAFSVTTSAWLSQHFYWQWKYSMDGHFLRDRAYPWIKDACLFLEKLSVILPDSSRTLWLSSSPELYDNSEKAWFKSTTNYDLALIRNLYIMAKEMADSLNIQADAERWENTLSRWPKLALGSDSSLLIARGHPLPYSHRHFSHLLVIYPLGLVNKMNPGENAVIHKSMKQIDELGTKTWCGYSFAWYALLQARAGAGEKAADALRIFVNAFTNVSSFHVNGDQSDMGYSDKHERVMTLEGNMAFAAAVQEMLLQSNGGIIKIFPALPADWVEASFANLRAEGAFLVSASRENGQTVQVRLLSEKGGVLRLLNPFRDRQFKVEGVETYEVEGNTLRISTLPGQIINLY